MLDSPFIHLLQSQFTAQAAELERERERERDKGDNRGLFHSASVVLPLDLQAQSNTKYFSDLEAISFNEQEIAHIRRAVCSKERNALCKMVEGANSRHYYKTVGPRQSFH